jgi:hypothetical protein
MRSSGGGGACDRDRDDTYIVQLHMTMTMTMAGSWQMAQLTVAQNIIPHNIQSIHANTHTNARPAASCELLLKVKALELEGSPRLVLMPCAASRISGPQQPARVAVRQNGHPQLILISRSVLRSCQV